MTTHLTPAAGVGAPVRWLLSPDLMPDARAIASLERLAKMPALVHHVAVLPDVHLKSGQATPTGTVFAARGAVLPTAVDAGIGCGIRMVSSRVPARALDAGALDGIFRELMRRVPVARHETEVLTPGEVEAILTEGPAWCVRARGLPPAELDAVEDTALASEDDDPGLAAAVPLKAKQKAMRTFGTLGGGNHFVELQEIVEVLDPERAAAWGLAEGQAFFMIHTGSRSIGSKTIKGMVREHGGDPESLIEIPTHSDSGRAAAAAIRGATRFGFANRAMIHQALRDAVRRVLGDRAPELPLLFDCAHVSIRPERWNGEALWVHRHGASRALPASAIAGHPVFSRTGQPAPVPGSMGHDSFVCAAAEGALEAFGSVNHGAGRTLDKPEAGARFTDGMIESEMRTKGIRLYRYGLGSIAEQAPAAFKSISRVVDAMAALSLARPVARLRPVAVLKG